MKNFVKLKTNLENTTILRQFISVHQYWKNVQGFKAMPAPIFFLQRNRVLSEILTKFNGQAVFLRSEKNSMYNWHRDLDRTVVINSLIEGFDSFTMFTDTEIDNMQGTSTGVEELTYNDGECYLLNVQNLHAVYNRHSIRTVLSLSFYKPVSYEQILEYCFSKDFVDHS